jgi:hypothetical protein
MTGWIIARYFTKLTSISCLNLAYSQIQSRNTDSLRATMVTEITVYYHKIFCKIYLYGLSPTRPIPRP